MADTTSTFLKRVISGVLAAALILSVGHFVGRPGYLLACAAVMVLSLREFSRMVFPSESSLKTLGIWYWLVCLSTFVLIFIYPNTGEFTFTLANVIFLVGGLWVARNSVKNEVLWPALGAGLVGLLYCTLFPAFAVQIVRLDDGDNWFLTLLLVVFFGDIFAYFFGRWFGRRKLMPQISPNKTWAGAAGGLLGSTIAGTIHVSSFSTIAPWKIIAFCLVCGVVAQSGDLLLSLIKRVSNVKDTGTIMPGHGGILDRLDGILIACPVVYAFAQYATQI